MGAGDLLIWLQHTAHGPTPPAHTPAEPPKPRQAARKAPANAAAGTQAGSASQRVELFTRRGMGLEQAQELATRCRARDLDMLAPYPHRPGGTGMAACMECAHLGRAGGGRYRCGNWRELDMSRGAALLASRFVAEFHRCSGFEYPIATEPDHR